MSKYDYVKVYILQDGQTRPCPLASQTFVEHNYISDILRDKRKLLLEISRGGNICLSFKDVHLDLTRQQIQQIYGIWKNLRHNSNPPAYPRESSE